MKSTVEAVDNHAAIFNAYLSRLSLKDMERINEAVKRSWHASHNIGLIPWCPIKAQNNQLEVVKEVLGKWMNDDLNNVEIIINRNI